MGLLALQRLMSLQQDRRQRQRQRRRRAQNGSVDSSVDKRKGSPCQQDAHGDSHAFKRTHGDSHAVQRTHGDPHAVKRTHGDPHTVERMMCSVPTLPEDILHHIHSVLPLRDAARAACSSHAFLRSWRCHPNLTLNKHILGSNENASRQNFSCIIDNMLKNHSGSHIKILKLQLYGIPDSYQYLDSWLQVAVIPGIEELTIEPYRTDMKYNVPCTLLTEGVQNSIRYLQLSNCAFHPMAELGPFRNLKNLLLRSVHISDNELECFLSNCHSLEKLDLNDCQKITCLKIPCILLQFHSLKVYGCLQLQVIESKARNLSCFILTGESVKVSLGETLQMKNLCMGRSNLVSYARVRLSSSMPNLKTLSIRSHYELVNTPMVRTKFLFLKWLSIKLRLDSCPSYNYFSLVSFLDASPSLETWLLDVAEESMEHESIFGGGSLELRQMPEQHHGRLKTVRFKGFNSAKGLVELACYILTNAKSLGQLTLDTTYGDPKCDNEMSGGWCTPMSKEFLMEARRGVSAIRTYIKDKVPPTVRLTVVKHCTRCHADKLSE